MLLSRQFGERTALPMGKHRRISAAPSNPSAPHAGVRSTSARLSPTSPSGRRGASHPPGRGTSYIRTQEAKCALHTSARGRRDAPLLAALRLTVLQIPLQRAVKGAQAKVPLQPGLQGVAVNPHWPRRPFSSLTGRNGQLAPAGLHIPDSHAGATQLSARCYMGNGIRTLVRPQFRPPPFPMALSTPHTQIGRAHV